jgi:hypothetical protein
MSSSKGTRAEGGASRGRHDQAPSELGFEFAAASADLLVLGAGCCRRSPSSFEATMFVNVI